MLVKKCRRCNANYANDKDDNIDSVWNSNGSVWVAASHFASLPCKFAITASMASICALMLYGINRRKSFFSSLAERNNSHMFCLYTPPGSALFSCCSC